MIKLLLTLLLGFLAVTPALAGEAASKPASGILCAYWRETPGALVTDLTSLPSYPDFPGEQVILKDFEIPENQEANFGSRLRGFLQPPTGGAYTFFIAGNGQCELWLSSDKNPAHATRIAGVEQWSMPRDWKASPAQQSRPIELKAGQRYYIEARHKNGGGDNHLAVAWKLPSGEMEAPIPGSRLAPAAEVVVPPPKVKLPALPTAAGKHRISVEVEYRTEHVNVPVLLTLPQAFSAGKKLPALVFLPDTTQEPADDGFYLQGPDREPAPAAAAGFICLSVQPPSDRNFEQRLTIQAIAAAVQDLLAHLPVEHVSLTGPGAGGAAVWRLALAMPAAYRTVAPICGTEVRDPALVDRLRGTRVRIYTDIAEGFATECANRMKEHLAGLTPAAEVVYLGEKELAGGNAADYCYAQPDFYASLFAPRPATAVPPSAAVPVWRLNARSLGVLLLAVAVVIWWTMLRRRA